MVYLKNTISLWMAESISDEPPAKKIDFTEEEQTFFKSHILSLLVGADRQMFNLYLEVFRHLADVHFPRNWPPLISTLNKLMTSNNFPQMYTALRCVATLTRRFVYVQS